MRTEDVMSLLSQLTTNDVQAYRNPVEVWKRLQIAY